jgi:hypothetical protein
MERDASLYIKGHDWPGIVEGYGFRKHDQSAELFSVLDGAE